MTFFIMILIIVILNGILAIFTEIKIQMKDFRLQIDNQNKKINNGFKVIIKLNIFNKINYFKFTLNNDKIKRYNVKQNLNKLFKQVTKNQDKKISKSSKNKKSIKIEKLNLDIGVGIENVALTAMVTGISSIVLSILIGKNVNKSKEIKWNIYPVYNNKLLKVDLNCIISIKLIHIIKRIYLMRKEVDKNAGTSNRKNFKYIYE